MTTLSRRPRRRARSALAAAALALLASLSAVAAASEAVPANPLARLRGGNDRFVKGTTAPMSAGPAARRALAAAGQPFAMVLSCADARVPPEYIFDAGLGDLFVVRTAGAVVDKAVLASLEYGAAHLHVPLLVVMGHDACDVVKAAGAATPLEGPNLDYAARAIRAGTGRTPAEQHELRAAVLANVEQVINDAMAGSVILREAATAGRLQVVGAYHDSGTGRVIFSEPVGATTAPAPAPAHK